MGQQEHAGRAAMGKEPTAGQPGFALPRAQARCEAVCWAAAAVHGEVLTFPVI